MAADSEFVHMSLKEFIKKHTPNAELSGIDDIVISYVVGVVEDAVIGETVDSEGVKELVAAYEPSFAEVSLDEVTKWIEDTVKSIKELKDEGKNSPSVTLDAIVSSFPCETKRTHAATDVLSPNVDSLDASVKQRKTSSSSSVSSTTSTSGIETLLELFPDACRLDVERCLHTAGGDVEEAIAIMLDTPLTNRISALDSAVTKSHSPKVVDDNTVKASIINRYGFIDHDEDRREHRPILPKWEGKKMVRYRDNKVVSLKGERYTEIKKDDENYIKKSNAVHAKAGRQYKMH